MDYTATILQDQTPYITQKQLGAVAQDRLSIPYDGDSSNTDKTVFTYGEFVALGPNKGVQKLAATTTVGKLLGTVKYQNSGVIDVSGYQMLKGFYSNVPVLKQGVQWIGSYGTVDIDSTLYLYVDPTNAHYGKVRNGADSGAIDISSISKVIKLANSDNLVCVDIQIL
jgi:hypothetical protein